MHGSERTPFEKTVRYLLEKCAAIQCPQRSAVNEQCFVSEELKKAGQLSFTKSPFRGSRARRCHCPQSAVLGCGGLALSRVSSRAHPLQSLLCKLCFPRSITHTEHFLRVLFSFFFSPSPPSPSFPNPPPFLGPQNSSVS